MSGGNQCSFTLLIPVTYIVRKPSIMQSSTETKPSSSSSHREYQVCSLSYAYNEWQYIVKKMCLLDSYMLAVL